MLFKWFARGLLIVVYVAICVYAVVADTGPAGWINYAQQSLFGSYSQKVTLLIAIFASLVVIAPLWWLLDVIGRRIGVPDAVEPARLAEPPKPASAKTLLMSSFVAIPLIWIGGYAIWWYYQHEQQQDARATYEPLRLVRGAAAPAASGAYVAVSGRLLWERTVSLTKGRASSERVEYTLVPLVADGWRDDDPVPYVVRVDPKNRYLAERATRNREAVLGHAEGSVAVPAAQEFQKMQVPVADARQLRLVPSERGAPAVKDTADEDFQIYLVIAAGLSVFYVLIVLVLIAAYANERRKERKAALKTAQGGR